MAASISAFMPGMGTIPIVVLIGYLVISHAAASALRPGLTILRHGPRARAVEANSSAGAASYAVNHKYSLHAQIMKLELIHRYSSIRLQAIYARISEADFLYVQEWVRSDQERFRRLQRREPCTTLCFWQAGNLQYAECTERINRMYAAKHGYEVQVIASDAVDLEGRAPYWGKVKALQV